MILPNGSELRIDYSGLGKIMRSKGMQGVMAEFANKMAAELLARGIDRVWVSTYTTDRGAASITLPDISDGQELKFGYLADAAAAVGLEIKQTGGLGE